MNAPESTRRPDAPTHWRDLFRGNLLWLSAASLLNDAASEMAYPLLPLFLVGTLGAGPAFLGLVEGVADSLSALLKWAGGWLADRVGRRKPLVASGYGIAAAIRPLFAIATAPWHVLAIRTTDRVGKGLRTAPRDALLAASVPETHRGRAFGIHRAADHSGALIGPLLASGILLLAPGRLRLVFALTIVPGILTVAAVLFGVRERKATPGDVVEAAHHASPAAAAQPAPERDPAFLAYLGVLLVFTLGNASDAFLLLRARDLGVATALVPLLWSALHLSKTGFNLIGGWIADRWGPRPTLVAGWLVYAAVYAGFALASTQWHAWALFGVYGLFYGLTEAPEKVLVTSFAGASSRARAFGAYHLAIGIGALPASLLFGWLWSARSPSFAFLVGAGLALLAAVVLPMLPRPRTAP